MSPHTRGILLHLGAGVFVCAALVAALPGVRDWRRPAIPAKPAGVQLAFENYDRARSRGDVVALREFYAPDFAGVDITTAWGDARRVTIGAFLNSLVSQATTIEWERIGPPDASGNMPSQSPPFDMGAPHGESTAPHRHFLLWSWDGSAWKIVRHRIEPVDAQ